MNEDKDIQLLREYVRESLVSEDVATTTGYYGRVGRAALARAAQRAGKGVEATKQRGAEFVASLKNLFKRTVASTAQLLTAGLFDANIDKIHKEYLDELQNIRKTYRNVADEWDAAMGEKLAPIVTAAILINPGAAGPAVAKALAAKVGMGRAAEIARKAEENALKSGASDKFKKVVDDYYGKINKQIDAAEVASRQRSLRSDEEKRNNAISSLKNVESSLTNEFRQLQKLGKENEVYKEHAKTLEKLQKVLADLSSK